MLSSDLEKNGCMCDRALPFFLLLFGDDEVLVWLDSYALRSSPIQTPDGLINVMSWTNTNPLLQFNLKGNLGNSASPPDLAFDAGLI